jgi:hypothetical protein
VVDRFCLIFVKPYRILTLCSVGKKNL